MDNNLLKIGLEKNAAFGKVPSTLETRCKKQEIRLSSVDIKILPKEQDSIRLASP